jgi:hypothetical protein
MDRELKFKAATKLQSVRFRHLHKITKLIIHAIDLNSIACKCDLKHKEAIILTATNCKKISKAGTFLTKKMISESVHNYRYAIYEINFQCYQDIQFL